MVALVSSLSFIFQKFYFTKNCNPLETTLMVETRKSVITEPSLAPYLSALAFWNMYQVCKFDFDELDFCLFRT